MLVTVEHRLSVFKPPIRMPNVGDLQHLCGACFAERTRAVSRSDVRQTCVCHANNLMTHVQLNILAGSAQCREVIRILPLQDTQRRFLLRGLCLRLLSSKSLVSAMIHILLSLHSSTTDSMWVLHKLLSSRFGREWVRNGERKGRTRNIAVRLWRIYGCFLRVVSLISIARAKDIMLAWLVSLIIFAPCLLLET